MPSTDREAVVRAYLASVGDAIELPFGRRTDDEFDYLREGGLTRDDWPVLVEVATSWVETYDKPWPEDDPTVWAPVHAWRALAQLGVAEAFAPLLPLLAVMDANDDDFLHEEFDEVLARLGPDHVPALLRVATDKGVGEFARVAAFDAIGLIGRFYPERRDEAVGVLTERLAQSHQDTPIVNGSLISELIEFKAVESAETIRKAFSRQHVDFFAAGDWPTVRQELGLPPEPQRRIDKPDPRDQARAKKKRERQARTKSRRR